MTISGCRHPACPGMLAPTGSHHDPSHGLLAMVGKPPSDRPRVGSGGRVVGRVIGGGRDGWFPEPSAMVVRAARRHPPVRSVRRAQVVLSVPRRRQGSTGSSALVGYLGMSGSASTGMRPAGLSRQARIDGSRVCRVGIGGVGIGGVGRGRRLRCAVGRQRWFAVLRCFAVPWRVADFGRLSSECRSRRSGVVAAVAHPSRGGLTCSSSSSAAARSATTSTGAARGRP